MRNAACLVAALLSCACNFRPTPLDVQPVGGRQTSPQLQLEAWHYWDFFVEVGLRIRLRNVSDRSLEQCKLGLNGEYWTDLGELDVPIRPRLRSDLRPSEAVTFDFFHDNDNYRDLRRRDGSWYPSNAIPTLVAVACEGFDATWRVE